MFLIAEEAEQVCFLCRSVSSETWLHTSTSPFPLLCHVAPVVVTILYVLVLTWWAGCPPLPYLSDSGGTSQAHEDMRLKIISPSVPCNNSGVCEPECTYWGIQPGLSIAPLDEADITTLNIISLNNPHPGSLQLGVYVREYRGLCLLKRVHFLTNEKWATLSYFVCVCVCLCHRNMRWPCRVPGWWHVLMLPQAVLWHVGESGDVTLSNSQQYNVCATTFVLEFKPFYIFPTYSLAVRWFNITFPS